jgi:hypothetical protein
MNRFIDREGFEMEGIEPISISKNVKLKEKFRVNIFPSESILSSINSEEFDSYPNKNQILWAIKKNKGEAAEIHKIYYIEDIPF